MLYYAEKGRKFKRKGRQEDGILCRRKRRTRKKKKKKATGKENNNMGITRKTRQTR